MQNLEVVASKYAYLCLFSLRLDTHLSMCYTQAVRLGRLDTSVISQLPCPVSPELSTKQIGQSEGSNWYTTWHTPFKVLYSSSVAWLFRQLHQTCFWLECPNNCVGSTCLPLENRVRLTFVHASRQPVPNQGDRSSYNKTSLIKINFMRPVLTLSASLTHKCVIWFSNGLSCNWHSEVSKMVWHFVIGSTVQKLQNF